MASTPRVLLPLQRLLLGTVFVVACKNAPTDDVTIEDTKPIITAPGNIIDFPLIQNTDSPVAVHCDQAVINGIADPAARFTEAFDCGDELFGAKFNELDGIGANVGEGKRFTRTPRADLKGAGEWFNHVPARITGPNSQSCSECHRDGTEDGAGPIETHAVRDPSRNAILSQFIERSTPHLNGMGAVQLLAEQMTTALQAQLAAARARLTGAVTSTTQAFSANGISFGTATVTATTVTGLQGIDADLVVKPFQWKGSVKFVRDFVRGAGHNELGMQAVELTGVGVDGDGDGVVNELGFGDVSAMAAYMGTQVRPVTKIELNTLNLLETPLTAAQIASINRGSTVFTQVGCATCHVPAMVLNNPVFSEPSQNANHRDGTFPSGVNPISVGVDPATPIRANLITDLPDNRIAFANGDLLGGLERNRATDALAGSAVVRAFTDLKRHDMGAGLREPIADDGVENQTWMTRGLWGTGATGPWLHDGRATTLMSAILEHGGEAAAARANVRGLSIQSQRDLVAFLDNLTLGMFDNTTGGGGAGGAGGATGAGGSTGAGGTTGAAGAAGGTVNLTATVAVQSEFRTGYCEAITVRNTSGQTVQNWKVVMNIGTATISQLWNGTFNPATGTVTVSSQFSWQALAPGASLNSTGFCANRAAGVTTGTAAIVSASGGT